MAMVKIASLNITPGLLNLVAEVDEFKGAWRALGRLAPERLRALRKVATIESVGSSTRIEGAKLSDREVEALLSRVRSESFASRDEQEVAGYAQVMDVVFESHDAIPVTESHIKQLHGMLLRHAEKDARHRGGYKTLANNVEAFDADGRSMGVVFETSTPFKTPRDMAELIAWYREVVADKTLHPLVVTGVFVVVFLAIHPFQDGNGRLSRVLTTLLLLKAGYAYVPYSSLESIIEQSKDAYYLALRRTQGTLKLDSPDWLPWLTFFLQALQKQKRHLEVKVEREKLLRAAMSAVSVAILELAAELGAVSVGDILAATKTPRGTIKKRLTELVKAGHLKSTGKGRGVRYSLA
jgi:Fic family protein